MGSLTTTQLIFILLLQIIVLLFGFLAFSLYKLKKIQKQPVHEDPSPVKNISSDEVMFAYLDSEMSKVSQQIKQREESDAAKDVVGLKLRHEILKFENEYIKLKIGNEQSGKEENWGEINLQVYKFLKENGFNRDMEHLKKAFDNGEDEPVISESLMEQQSRTIEHLKSFINDLLSQMDDGAVPNADLDKHFNELEQLKVELEQCVMILEDENSFLRDQISALLKIHNDD